MNRQGSAAAAVCMVLRTMTPGAPACIALAALSCSATIASADTNPASTPTAPAGPTDAKGALGPVTIEATRRNAELRRQVDAFVSSVVTHYSDRALARWHTPICPLVAGLPREQGEFILARLSQSVTAAHAPLAPEHCNANLFIVLADEPELLLRKWRSRDRSMFDDKDGEGAIKRFIGTPRPVRVWYNSAVASDDGEPLTSDSFPLAGSLSPVLTGHNQFPVNNVRLGTRLQFGAVRQLASVILVIDASFVKGINVGQLADYVTMVSLADVRINPNIGNTPTILHLFDRNPETTLNGLGDFDRALLLSLYTTDQKSVMQESQMETRMLEALAP